MPVVAYLLIGILITLLVASRQESVFWDYLNQNKILWAIIISTLLSSLLSDLWYISILSSILYIMKIFFCSVVSSYLEESHMDKLVLLFLCLGILVSCIGIIQYFYFNGDMPSSWVDTNIYSISFRAYSTFINPNILAVFLNLTILAGLVRLESNKFRINKIIAISCIILSTTCILLTYSRNGWLSLCITLIALSFINKKYRKYCIIFPIIFLMFDFLGDIGRLFPQNMITDSSIEYRIKIWTATIRIIKDNLMLGIGQGTIWEQVPLYSSELKAYISHAHNIYLQRLVDTGIIGLFLFIWFIKFLWGKIKEDVLKNKEISVIAFSFYITLLVNGFFDAICFQMQISIFVWTFIGISLMKTKPSNEDLNKHNKIYSKNN